MKADIHSQTCKNKKLNQLKKKKSKDPNMFENKSERKMLQNLKE